MRIKTLRARLSEPGRAPDGITLGKVLGYDWSGEVAINPAAVESVRDYGEHKVFPSEELHTLSIIRMRSGQEYVVAGTLEEIGGQVG